MRLLALDGGNSRLTAAVLENGVWQGGDGLPTSEVEAGGGGVERLIRSVLTACDSGPIEGAVACLVRPGLTGVVSSAVQAVLGLPLSRVGHELRPEIEIRYRPPTGCGRDRVLGAWKAREEFGAPVIVVDFGTATTFDVVSADGAFIGGAIAPGVSVAAEALFRAAPRLPRIAPRAPLTALGSDTEHGLASGIYGGYRHLVDGLVGQLIDELGGEPTVIATGGWSELMAPVCTRIRHHRPHLLLEAMAQLFAEAAP